MWSPFCSYVNSSDDACGSACNTLKAAVAVAGNKQERCSMPGHYIPAPAGRSELLPLHHSHPCNNHDDDGDNSGPAQKHCRRPAPAKLLPVLL